MTKEQLEAIRARLDEVPRIPWNASLLRLLNDDASALLAEVERLTAEVESKVSQNVALIGMNGRLQQEVERLTADPLPAAAWVREVERAAFQRGVAATREAAAQRCEISPIHGEKTTTARKYADAVRALPDPEDKS